MSSKNVSDHFSSPNWLLHHDDAPFLIPLAMQSISRRKKAKKAFFFSNWNLFQRKIGFSEKRLHSSSLLTKMFEKCSFHQKMGGGWTWEIHDKFQWTTFFGDGFAVVITQLCQGTEGKKMPTIYWEKKPVFIVVEKKNQSFWVFWKDKNSWFFFHFSF